MAQGGGGHVRRIGWESEASSVLLKLQHAHESSRGLVKMQLLGGRGIQDGEHMYTHG